AAAEGAAGHHHTDHRPPAVHSSDRRPGRSAAPRQNRRGRHPQRAAHPQRRLPRDHEAAPCHRGCADGLHPRRSERTVGSGGAPMSQDTQVRRSGPSEGRTGADGTSAGSRRGDSTGEDTAALDLSQQAPDPQHDDFHHLRGTAGEEQVSLSKQERKCIRRRSLGLLVRASEGVRKKLLLTALAVVASQGAQAATPFIAGGLAIDWGLPRLMDGDPTGLWVPASLYLLCAITAGVLLYFYTRMTA